MEQIGAVAGRQYRGNGLSVAGTPEGARLNCRFQKLESEATREGLWLTSTTDGVNGERFRVLAVGMGRDGPGVSSEVRKVEGDGALGMSNRSVLLPGAGGVVVADRVVQFIRPWLTEEYSVSIDGVRQDFVVLERPEGRGLLRLQLDLTGAKAEARLNGARLVLDGSGRRIAYSRLRVTDATGKELVARIEIASAGDGVKSLNSNGQSAKRAGETRQSSLAVVVDDANAVYPVRIDPTFSDENWVSMGGLPGANNTVNAAVVDGAGSLFIGGSFTIVGDVFANRVAKWNGSSWSALGSGLNDEVNALAVCGSDLYVGGGFNAAGGGPAVYVAKWNGSSWSALGSGVDFFVQALAVSGTELYAGGVVWQGGGGVAKWDGSSWSQLGTGMRVYALAVSGSDLYAGGYFTSAGGGPANYVARWNGSSWSPLGAGLGGVASPCVYALAVSGSDLYVGGRFTTAGDTPASYVAKWDGDSWSSLDSGIWGGSSPQVRGLAVSGKDLYVAGGFGMAGAGAAANVAKWDGKAWSALGAGLEESPYSPSAYALAVSGSNVFVGGQFMKAGSGGAPRVAKWDGGDWSALGAGLNGYVYALAMLESDLYVGGAFTKAGGIAASNIVKWNGISWSALGAGVNGSVDALAMSGSDLYVGGQFSMAGGIAATNIAKWNGSSWLPLGSGVGGGPGVTPWGSPFVAALAVLGKDLYVGGCFARAGDSTATNVAMWNGSNWSALGVGVGGFGAWGNPAVYALAVCGSDLYAGGGFTMAGGNAATNMAKWNGSGWSALGAGVWGDFNAAVYALATSGTDIFVGGEFTTAGVGAATNLAKWDGASWSALGPVVGNGSWVPGVYALAISSSNLYVGGTFTAAGGSAANGIGKWDGSNWSALGSGVGGSWPQAVYALAASGSDLYVGGEFYTAGGEVSANVARAVIGTVGGRFTDPAYSPADGFSCIFRGATPGQSYRIQASRSLAVGSWTDLTNFTYAGAVTITDRVPTGTSYRFYRAVSP